ncbi:junctional adhesion molecule 2A-like [Macrobrachium rosenbergii]|uniref:junctional adhesion molecule 2A-like n=1 Tax=Macrobrachium rosenbergii TaxID=79674 RepID=UPI0034D61DD1
MAKSNALMGSSSPVTFTTTILLLRSLLVCGQGVVLTSVEVPEHVSRGQDVELKCLWNLTSHKLYSVKWYRDGREFFRFMPSESPPKAVYDQPGIHVNKELSTGETVILRNVDLSSGGRYKCEVISDGEFHTADKSGIMMVVEVPEEKPTIHGTKHKYHIGDNARLTCVSANSTPPAQLTWYINDRKVPPEYLVQAPSVKYPNGLMQTRLGLSFVITRNHFQNGEMTLRCSARVSSIYHKTEQHSIDGHLTYNVPVMESRDLAAFSGSAKSCTPPILATALVFATMLVKMVVAGALKRYPS